MLANYQRDMAVPGFDVDAGPAFGFYIIPIYTPVRDRQDYQAVFN